jgi:hypothetical protein
VTLSLRAAVNSADTSYPCLALLGQLTADKGKNKDFPKLPSATSFIRKMLYEIPNPAVEKIKYLNVGSLLGKRGDCHGQTL